MINFNSPRFNQLRIFALVILFGALANWSNAQELCRSDTSFTDIIFLIDNSQSIDEQEFDEFSDIIVATINKVKERCSDSQLGVVHYGGAFGKETVIGYPLSKDTGIENIQRRFCTMRNSSGFCSEGGGDDLNHAIGEIMISLENGDLNRNPNNTLQLVIFTDAFGFDENCTFINCSVIKPFTNIDLLKSNYGANVTVVGASAQAEASLLAIYASPGGDFDNVVLNEDCQNTVDGCVSPRKYIPVQFDSPVQATSDSIANFVECNINIIQAVNPELGANLSICGDMGESATLTVNLPEGENGLTYTWSPELPNSATVTVSPSVTTTYTVVVSDQNGCTGTDAVTVFVEDCAPDCSPDTSYTDIIFLVDNSQSIDDQEFSNFENIILTTMKKVEAKCQASQLGLVHYGGAFGAETEVEYQLSNSNTFTAVERRFCTMRNSSGFCSEGGGDDLNHAIGDIITALEDGSLNRNPINKLRLVIFTDAFGFEEECSFINCSVIRPFTNIDRLKSEFEAKVTVVGASAQAEASLLAIYASPGGQFDNVVLHSDCESTFDGCQSPRKYIPIEFNSPVEEATDSIVACVDCDVEIIPGFVIDLGETQTICSDLDESATITAAITNGVEPIQYTWDNGLPSQNTVTVQPLVTTTYNLSATDAIGCMTTASVTILVEDCVPDCVDPPVFSSCPAAYETCPGGSIDPSVTGMPVVVSGGESCSEPVISYRDDTTAVMGCNYAISRTWSATYTDFPELVSSCVQSIQIMDMTAPEIINIPEDIIVDSDQACRATVSWTPPTANDNCALISIQSNIQSGTTFDIGVTEIRYTAIDQCGNIAMSTFTVTVNEACCTTPPTITCAPAFTGCPSSDLDPSVTGSPTAGPGSANCPDPILTYEDEVQGGFTSCERTILRTWTASYPGINDGNLTATCVQTITLQDTEDPSITNIPANITMDSDAQCTAVVTWDIPLANDNCGVASLVANHNSGDLFDIGSTEVTYTATDNCGNTSTASFTVTIIENCCSTPPVITCPEDYTACPNSSTDPSITGIAIALPGAPECPDPGVSFSDEIVAGSDNCSTTIRRTWKATYGGVIDAGLASTCVQIITLVDNEPPVITDVPSNITVDSDQSCSAIVSWSSPSASDNCGVPTVSSDINSGSSFESGTTTVTFTATDQCGNTSTASFTVTVIERCCKVPPVLSCPSNYQGCPGDPITTDITGMAVAVAGSADCPNPSVTFSDVILSDTSDCYTLIERTFTASYPGSNDPNLTTTCTQLITLIDIEAPIITGLPDNMVIASDANCLSTVVWDDPIALDNCSIGQVSADIPSGSTFDIGTTTVTYTVVDDCGNMKQASFTITITKACCTEVPVIVCPADYTTCIGSSIDPSVSGMANGVGGTAFCQDPTITYNDVILSEGPHGDRVIERTWKAQDPLTDSLMTSCIQTITLEDTESPVMSDCPEDVTLDPDNPVHSWDEPTFTDNCEATITVNIPSGSTFETGVTIVTYTVTDIGGNEVSCSFEVTVPEEVMITCPEDVVLRCNEDLNLDDLPAPEYKTNCPACQEDNIDGFSFLGFRNGQSYYISDKVDDWQEANTTAQAVGGYLVIINDAEENEYIKNLLNENSAFIGLQDYDSEGNFTWSDGSSISYSNWFDGQPNNYGNRQDYVEIMKNGEWNDQSNNKSLKYIIEVNCVELTKSIDNIEEIGESTIYTVTYSAVDRCGTDDVCSFKVTTDNAPKFECPDDITVNVPYGWSRVHWDDPVYNTCCTICPARSIKGYIYMGNLGDSYYYCSAGRASWRASERRAKEIGGQLVVIETQEENDYISSRIIRREAYIGLTDQDSEGNFKWVDGTNPTFKNWSSSQPDTDGDYVHLNSTGRWYDDNGSEQREFVVEIKGCDHVDQIGGPLSGSTFRTGSTTITYRAEDGCGGVDTCSFNIIITSNASDEIASSRSAVKEVSISANIDFDVYPNPVASMLYVDIKSDLSKLSEVQIFQSNGQLISTFSPTRLERNSVDVSNYASGLYLMKVTDTKGNLKVKKFTVK